MRPAWIALLLLVPFSTAGAFADEAEANAFLQPGTQVNTPVGQCTLNFVWKDAQSTYIGTAGHCVSGTGGRVSTPGHGQWGTVVLDIDGSTDFALIRVDAAKVAAVRAEVQHWGGPTGVATQGETAAGDLLALYGYGIVFSTTEPTRAKQGVLLSNNGQRYVADTWAVNGDSGGPILQKSTGKALGIVSAYNLPVSTDVGPTLTHIEAQLAARGYALTLQTAAPTGALV